MICINYSMVSRAVWPWCQYRTGPLFKFFIGHTVPLFGDFCDHFSCANQRFANGCHVEFPEVCCMANTAWAVPLICSRKIHFINEIVVLM